MELTHVYLLQHMYEYDSGDGEMLEATKVLGIFSTEDEGKKAIEFYRPLPGFKDHSAECFYLDRFEINRKSWDDGFVAPFDDEDEE